MESDRPGCRVCGGSHLRVTVRRSQLPAMQNRVYRTQELATAANGGQLDLAICATCGFAFNSAFDSTRLKYDQDYDNSVPSAVTGRYYEEIARYLKSKYLPDDGLIIDVGCGKGTFLKTICRLFPNVRGLGIDPSYEGPLEDPESSLRFIPDFFSERHVEQRPHLVICRHVLEHIEHPVDFLKSIRSAIGPHTNVPILLEVPDLNWIIRNNAFWDFCYEHCNYFTPTSFSNAATLAGFRVTETHPGFGDQYLWLEAVAGNEAGDHAQSFGSAAQLLDEVQSYVANENNLVTSARSTILKARSQGRMIVIWGMATKGILFTCLVDPERTLFDYCVDLNNNKHGCHVPTTGHRIDPPEILKSARGCEMLIIVMNPNYLGEIQSQCYELGVSATFMTPNGEQV